MFRVQLCLSSGTHDDSVAYHIGRLVLELLLSPRESDVTRCCTNTIVLLKMNIKWSKHVEDYNKFIKTKNLFIKLVKKTITISSRDGEYLLRGTHYCTTDSIPSLRGITRLMQIRSGNFHWECEQYNCAPHCCRRFYLKAQSYKHSFKWT